PVNESVQVTPAVPAVELALVTVQSLGAERLIEPVGRIRGLAKEQHGRDALAEKPDGRRPTPPPRLASCRPSVLPWPSSSHAGPTFPTDPRASRVTLTLRAERWHRVMRRAGAGYPARSAGGVARVSAGSGAQ